MRAPSKSIQHSSTPSLKGEAQRAKISLISFIQKLSPLRDNSFLLAGVYLRERLCRFTLGSFGSPFFVEVGARSLLRRMSGIRASCATELHIPHTAWTSSLIMIAY